MDINNLTTGNASSRIEGRISGFFPDETSSPLTWPTDYLIIALIGIIG